MLFDLHPDSAGSDVTGLHCKDEIGVPFDGFPDHRLTRSSSSSIWISMMEIGCRHRKKKLLPQQH